MYILETSNWVLNRYNLGEKNDDLHTLRKTKILKYQILYKNAQYLIRNIMADDHANYEGVLRFSITFDV